MKLPTLTPKTLDNYYKALFALLIASLFLPVRYVFEVPGNFLTGAYSDFTSFSFYSCDLIILGILIFQLFFDRLKFKPNKILLLWLIWVLGVFFLNIKGQIGLNWYFLARILEFIVLHETIRAKGSKHRELLFKVFLLFGLFESLLALAQFVGQRSIGLFLLGERHIDPNTFGVAKIAVEGMRMIRSYGTFPHANLLSAFLVTAILINVYFLLQDISKRRRILLSASLGLTIFGLFVTFSRAGFIGAAIGLAIFFVTALWQQQTKKRVILTGLVLGLWVLSATLMFKPYLLSRTQLLSDQSAKERIFYTMVGWEIIKSNPIMGVGIGTSVLHMEQFSPTPLEPWEVQPIHNYYLLAAAEFGIAGALILAYLLLNYLLKLFRKVRDSFSLYHLTLFSILASYLVLMIFDHYFYTIEQTQLLLWLILGLIAAEIYPKANLESDKK